MKRNDEPKNDLTLVQNEMERLAKLYSGIFVKAKVYPAADYKFWIKESDAEVKLKPSAFYLCLILFGLMIFFTIALYVAIAEDTYIPTIVMSVLLILAIVQINDYRRTYVLLSNRGIEVNNQFFLWVNVLECYAMEYPVQRGTNTVLIIFLTNGKYEQFDIEGIEYLRMLHYIYHYQKERELTFQPS